MRESDRISTIAGCAFAALSLCASLTLAQSWDTRRNVDLTSAQSALDTDEPVLIELGPGFDYGHARPNGEDVRIAEDVAGVFCVPVWIETWNDAGDSRVWASASNVPVGASSLQLFYGNPAGTAVSDFDAVFPDALIASGGEILSGTVSRRWIEIPSGVTVSIDPGVPAVLNARQVVVDGTIDGVGAGFAAGATLMPGEGPGGGGTSSNAGCGGGGYGGLGGGGGFDAGDTPGAPGPVYGSASSFAIQMGSGGGTSVNTSGGAGGGGLTIAAERVRGSGTIDLDAGAADQPGGSNGGGGGSGGGLLVHAYELDLGGATLNARGSDGSVGTIAANDSGGGGGGGRLKLFFESTLTPPALAQVTGGLGGPNGSVAGGENGAPGSFVTSSSEPFPEVAAAVGAAVSVSISTPCSGIFRDGFESGDTRRWIRNP